MEITRRADLQTVAGPEEFFTGNVTITGQFQRPEPSRVGGAIVHFEPGARTAWHIPGIRATQIASGLLREFHRAELGRGSVIEFQDWAAFLCLRRKASARKAAQACHSIHPLDHVNEGLL
jgi:hypothetical protein